MFFILFILPSSPSLSFFPPPSPLPTPPRQIHRLSFTPLLSLCPLPPLLFFFPSSSFSSSSTLSSSYLPLLLFFLLFFISSSTSFSSSFPHPSSFTLSFSYTHLLLPSLPPLALPPLPLLLFLLFSSSSPPPLPSLLLLSSPLLFHIVLFLLPY